MYRAALSLAFFTSRAGGDGGADDLSVIDLSEICVPGAPTPTLQIQYKRSHITSAALTGPQVQVMHVREVSGKPKRYVLGHLPVRGLLLAGCWTREKRARTTQQQTIARRNKMMINCDHRSSAAKLRVAGARCPPSLPPSHIPVPRYLPRIQTRNLL